ncbi:PorV/PorQ family protein [bacterium]|nr:PorV/PorQ family protein [bacterium]MBU1153084.1 PorV/PorQ family protein [bacterium]
MSYLKSSLVLIINLLSLFVFFDYSLAIHEKAGTTGANFLKIGMSAKATSMANSFTAIYGDINTLNYNPAGLSQIKNKQVYTMYNMWFQDIKHGYLALAIPLSFRDVMGLSFNYLKIDEIRKTNDTYPSGDLSLGTFNASDLAITLSNAFDINEHLSLGINLKVIKEKLANYKTSNLLSGDLGALIKLPFQDLTMGFCILNMGQKIKFEQEKDSLPLTYKIGISSKLFKKNLLVALEINKPTDNELNYRLGTEYTIAKTLALRAGYLSGPEEVRNNITYGLGLKLFKVALDYAFTPFDDLGDTHKISLTTSF